MRGGSRPGAGRKPRHGITKIDKNIALTPDVWACWEQMAAVDGVSVGEAIETKTRKMAAFRQFQKTSSKIPKSDD